jgi:parallel beta-helix repeat protein
MAPVTNQGARLAKLKPGVPTRIALRRALRTGLVVAAIAVAGGRIGATAGADTLRGCDAVAMRGDGARAMVDSLDRGETGCFRAGTYAFSRLSVDEPNITLAPYRSEAVILRGEIKVKPAGHGSTIEGLKLNGDGGASTIGPRIYADRVTLRDNEITNQHTDICVQVGSWYDGPPPERVVIARNRIHDCGELPSTNKDHGIYLSEARNAIVRDNWIYDNADRGIQLYPDADGSRITGNVVLANGDGLTINRSSSDNKVRGNIIADSVLGWNIYGGPDLTGSNNVVRDNCVRGRNSDPRYNVNGGIQSPPFHFQESENRIAAQRSVFVYRPSRDLRLQWDSSCRGKYTGTLSQPWSPKR